MITRQWMVTHRWMLKNTHQTEWIEGRGLLLWLAFYTGGLGGGMYLVSLYFDNIWGMLAGWLIVVVLKSSAHLAYLGKPWRCWRMVIRANNSWLSRGLLFVVFFTIFGAFQFAASYWQWDLVWETSLKAMTGIMALGIASYTGIILIRIKGVPFWNSFLLPVIFLFCGLLGGLALLLLIAIVQQSPDIARIESYSHLLLAVNAILFGVYLIQGFISDPTAKQSVIEQFNGRTAPIFWVAVVLSGIIIPLCIAILGQLDVHIPIIVLLMGIGGEIIGGMFLRYCILKGGAYKPILTYQNI